MAALPTVLLAFVIVCIGLGWLGSKRRRATMSSLRASSPSTTSAYFLVILRCWARLRGPSHAEFDRGVGVRKASRIGRPLRLNRSPRLEATPWSSRAPLAITVALAALATPARAQEHDTRTLR